MKSAVTMIRDLNSKHSCIVFCYEFFKFGYFLCYRNLFEKVKTDIRLMKEELSSIERNKPTKERSLSQLKASLEAMQATKEGLESELHQDLMATLSVQVSFYAENFCSSS